MKAASVLAFSTACLLTATAAPTSVSDLIFPEEAYKPQTSRNTTLPQATGTERLGSRGLTIPPAITRFFNRGSNSFGRQDIYPAPSRAKRFGNIISTLSGRRVSKWLTAFTANHNRYVHSLNGLEASVWVARRLANIAAERKDRQVKTPVTIFRYHHEWPQFSVIAKLHGSATTAPTIILAARLDSMNVEDPENGRAPGADENGAAVTALLEVYCALVQADFLPTRPIEFHFYSGDMLGSYSIVRWYTQERKSVFAMVNFLNVGYVAPGSKEVIALSQQASSEKLNIYLRYLARAYCSIPTEIDSADSTFGDHEEWFQSHYEATAAFGSLAKDRSPVTQSDQDTANVEGFSMSHVHEFAKLAAAVALELGSVRYGSFWRSNWERLCRMGSRVCRNRNGRVPLNPPVCGTMSPPNLNGYGDRGPDGRYTGGNGYKGGNGCTKQNGCIAQDGSIRQNGYAEIYRDRLCILWANTQEDL